MKAKYNKSKYIPILKNELSEVSNLREGGGGKGRREREREREREKYAAVISPSFPVQWVIFS